MNAFEPSASLPSIQPTREPGPDSLKGELQARRPNLRARSAAVCCPRFRVSFTSWVVLLMACLIGGVAASPGAELEYPRTRHTEQKDNYHGTIVADPFRWLEDDTSPQTKAWVDAENKVTFGYLEKLPERKALKDRLTKLWNFERYGVPFKEGRRYFFTKNDGLQNQSVLYTAESLSDPPRLLLDPNKLSTDGTAALSS